MHIQRYSPGFPLASLVASLGQTPAPLARNLCFVALFSGQIPSIDQIHTPRSPVRGRSDGDRNVLAQGSFPNHLFTFPAAQPWPLHSPSHSSHPLLWGLGARGPSSPSPQREIPVSQQRLPLLQNLHFHPALLLCVLLHSDTSVLSWSFLGSPLEESQTN